MKTFPALISLAVMAQGDFIKVNLQMDEHGVHYNQTEAYDPMTGDLITTVPEHQRDGLTFRALEKIENEGKRLSIWKFLIGTTCHLEELDATENLGIFLLEVASLEANNVTVTSSMMQTLYAYSIDGGEWNGTRTTLTTNMPGPSYQNGHQAGPYSRGV